MVELMNRAAGLVTIYDVVIVQGRPLDILKYSRWRDQMFERAWKIIGRSSTIIRAKLHYTLHSQTRVSISI